MVQKQDLFPPVNMFGNLYFVGTKPASTHVVDTGEGLIVFDTGYQHFQGLFARKIKEGLKVFKMGGVHIELLVDTLRYFAVVIVIGYLCPLLFKKIKL